MMIREAENEQSASRADRLAMALNWTLTALPIAGLGVVLAFVGWPIGTATETLLITISRGIAVAYGVLFVAHWLLAGRREGRSIARDAVMLALACFIGISALIENPLGELPLGAHLDLSPHMLMVTMAAVQQMLALATRVPAWLPFIERSFLKRVSPGIVLVTTFGLLISLGTLLLKMPNCATVPLSWLDALFTSTSAVCVTGLIVVDTANAFTGLGQFVILGLIQLGAFGIVTITFFLAVLSGQGFSVSSRAFLGDMLSVANLRELNVALTFIILFTLGIEALGAAVIYANWTDAAQPLPTQLWFAVFHSVSAFCNAGFSIYSAGLADPSTALNRPVQAAIMVLIVTGGIGFPVIMESLSLLRNRLSAKRPRRHASLHFKMVIALTAILIVFGALLIFFGTLPYYSGSSDRLLWESLFNAITARTAGFNITSIDLMPSAATAVLMLLMFIGGSPGGVAGGIKTTTFGVAMLNLRRILLAKPDIQLLGRRVEERISSRAFAVLLLSHIWILLATSLILFAQPELHLVDALFEAVSAFSTVGLSRGITAELSAFSRVIIIATMFVGRIGILNFFFSLVSSRFSGSHLRLPRERVLVE